MMLTNHTSRKPTMKTFHPILTVAAMAASVWSVQAATIDGTLDGAYGSALAVQTANTGFGSDIAANGGNQLDAAYGYISGGNLNLFFAGNTSDGNYLDVFIADGRAGQSTFSVGSTSTANMNGSVFSSGFSATYSLNLNTYSGIIYANLFDLVGNTGGYAGSTAVSGGTVGGIALAVNNSSAAGTGSNTGAGALAVTTGWEMSIPLSYLGNPNSVNVMVDINGGNDSYLSNQFLSGLPDGTANLGAGGSYSGSGPGVFNFASTPGEYFTVTTVPEPTTLALISLGGLSALVALRRRK